MLLNKMILTNFKGIEKLELTPMGHSLKVFGYNDTGKTTIEDAFIWLLFGKNSENKKEFDIKTIRGGSILHHLDYMVEAELDLENGKTLTLTRIYQEDWTTKRGYSTEELTGHHTDYRVDGVKVSATEFSNEVKKLMPEDTFRLITDPRYANEVFNWTQLRELLVTICGNVTDAEVIASKESLQSLVDILGGRPVDRMRAIIKEKIGQLNDDKEKIPIRISEADRTKKQKLNELGGKDKDGIELRIAALIRMKGEKEKLLTSSGNSLLISEKRGKVIEMQNELNGLGADERKAYREKIENAESAYRTKSSAVSRKENEIRETTEKVASLTRSFNSNEERMTSLRAQIQVLNIRQPSIDNTCSTCGQALPEDKVQEAIKKFNKTKSEDAERVNNEGLSFKHANEKIDEERRQLGHDLGRLEEERKILQEAKDTAQYDYEMLRDKEPPEPSGKEGLATKINGLQQEIQDLESGATHDTQGTKDEIARIENELAGCRRDIAFLEMIDAQDKRIGELSGNLKQVNIDIESWQSQMALIEQFTRAKVELMDERINQKFHKARFQLFKQNINGGLEECCVVLGNDGVPYPGLNNAQKINIGLDMIRTISEHYGVRAPIFIDNAESVCELEPIDAQIIQLIVSPEDKKLRIEEVA